ncbi:MAG TPA: carbohydrate kinase family protein [Actinomycetaceae bacterium]|nr:carbohydrate kinase family protein [Actinomycetaceae bacterium]
MKAVVVGIANQQTALPIRSFPVAYEANRYLPGAIRHTVGGVGFNVARTLSAFGHMVALASPLGEDYSAAMIDAEAYRYSISTHLCRRELTRTPRSVVLYDDAGRRQTNFDPAGAVDFVFREEHLAPDLFRAKLVVLGNSDMVAPLIDPLRERGRWLAVDLQEVHGAHNPADEKFLAADFLNMSNEYVKGSEREVLLGLRERSRARILTMTLGAAGALVLPSDVDEPVHVPAPRVRPRNTSGAGDIMFATLLHASLRLKEDPIAATTRAVEVASRYVASQAIHGSLDPERLRGILGLAPAVAAASAPEIAWNSYSGEA